MEIYYSSRKLEKILKDSRLIKKIYTNLYNTLINRLVELSSVDSLALISTSPPPRRHKLTGKFAGCWAIDLSRNYRLIISPHESQMGLHPTQINKIVIIDIVDYH